MSNTILPADKFDANTVFVRPEVALPRIALDNLAVLPGFNTRVKDDDYNERVAAIAESIVNNGFFDDKPFAVTMLPGDNTVYIYDGEHRFDAAKAALLDGADFVEGLPVAWAKDGATVRDLTIHLAHGNNGERLNMVELAAVVRRMQGLGMDKNEIAAALGRTGRHIDNLFVLAAANQTVKKAVASGKIAGAEAVKLLRKDAKTAGAVITERVKQAEEKGKAKATPKTVDAPKGPKTKTVQMSLDFTAGKTVAECLKSMATEIREFVEFNKADDSIQSDATVRFSVTVIDRAAEAEAERKAAEKLAAAEKRAADKLAADEKREAEKKAAVEKRAAEAKLLAEATVKGSDAKKPAAKKDKAPAEAKTPKATKPRRRAGKPAEATPAAEGAETPVEGAPVAPETESLPDDGMGGL